VIRGNAVGEMLRGLGHRRFVHKFYQLLGLEDANERRCYSAEKGRCVLEGATISPGEVSVLDLAMGLTGTSGSALEELLRTPAHRRVDVMEAGTEIVPSAFANISAFNASVAGLLEARLLEAYSRPAYIAEQLGEVIPSTKRSEKFIGISTVGDASLERKPGDPHVRAAGGEQYVTTPETKNRGIAIEVTREAVMFDLTRDLLAQAEKAADALALRKEYLMVDCVLGRHVVQHLPDGHALDQQHPESAGQLDGLRRSLAVVRRHDRSRDGRADRGPAQRGARHAGGVGQPLLLPQLG